MRKAYTDGALSGKHGGWAYVVNGEGVSGSLKTNDSYECELMAVCECLEQSDGKVCIVSDHWGIVGELREVMAGTHHAKKAKSVWQRIEWVKDKLEGVEWMKRMTTHEQRTAHSLATQQKESGVRRR